MIKVWDPLLRLFHWSLVVSIAVAWITSEGSETWHEWVGYVALGLIGFRLIWGVVGPRYARFSQFIRGPKQVVQYAEDMLSKREKRYIGHNPLGAVMVVALLTMTAATGVSGWLMVEPERLAMLPDMPTLVASAFASSDDDEEHEYGKEEEALEEIHEALASLLLVLIFLHIAGVVYASRRHKENLARAMVFGRKPAPDVDDIT